MEKNIDCKVTVVGLGLIGGSLYKAALQAGYSVSALDKNDAVHVEETDILLLALPQEKLVKWVRTYAPQLKRGAVVVDTCGVKTPVCEALKGLFPEGTTFVGGHPMAGKEHSGFAYADGALFKGASMILTPYPETSPEILEKLTRFFGTLGFERVLVTTPEHHDRMIAYTSQLSHVIAASYTQDPLSREVAGYVAGSYENMTRIASMDPVVWEQLFSSNKENLLETLDSFITRLQNFRNQLGGGNKEGVQRFIQRGVDSKLKDGLLKQRGNASQAGDLAFGKHLKLTVFGASHAPSIGMRLEHFPQGIPIDLQELQQFLERRAPGRDKFSTSRKEPDRPSFLSGLEDGKTTGGKIEAVISNTDVRSRDYEIQGMVPRPGHADYPQWVRTGQIPSGGGANSGRMTAPMCIAGGICLQWLAQRNIVVTARLAAVGGKTDGFEESILAAKADGDSVGGLIEVQVTGLPPGLGGAMFEGMESELSAALFGIPGVKGVEFGAGFAAAAMRGSMNNDPFVLKDGVVCTASNNHGGLLGGMTTGMPLVIRLAMKPTPSIAQEQRSVDLTTKQEATLRVHGRHDPCIARRAVPVAEALTAFVLADIILATEKATPRICLTLTEPTVKAAFETLKENLPFIDMVELRVDYLKESEWDAAAEFPQKAGLPVLLTIRRKEDGGLWEKDEEARKALYRKLLAETRIPFAFVDFEDDFRHADLVEVAHARGTRIIRSLHNFTGPVEDVVGKCQSMKGSSDEIPKIAFAVPHCSSLTRLFKETAQFTGFPHILCAMGAIGTTSRILACRTHSLLTFVSPAKAGAKMKAIGHLAPEELVRLYGFRTLTTATALYAITGWPLTVTGSPRLNNAAFFAEAKDAVMVPIPAETAEEAIRCAETLGIKGMAVTIPHKQAIIPFMSSLDETAKSIGAVNTVVKTPGGWKGFNTDAPGFRMALLQFLQTDGIRGRKVAILGAGGAARAVSYAIYTLGGDACIFNHTYEKAEALAKLYGFRAAPLAQESAPLLAQYADIIIQATSVGFNANPDDASADPIPFYEFRGTEFVYDVIYSPAVTPLLARAARAGCKTCNGSTMLVEQAKEQRRLYNLYHKEFQP